MLSTERGKQKPSPVFSSPSLDKAHSDSAHSGQLIHSLKTLIHRLRQEGCKFLVVKNLQVASCEDKNMATRHQFTSMKKFHLFPHMERNSSTLPFPSSSHVTLDTDSTNKVVKGIKIGYTNLTPCVPPRSTFNSKGNSNVGDT